MLSYCFTANSHFCYFLVVPTGTTILLANNMFTTYPGLPEELEQTSLQWIHTSIRSQHPRAMGETECQQAYWVQKNRCLLPNHQVACQSHHKSYECHYLLLQVHPKIHTRFLFDCHFNLIKALAQFQTYFREMHTLNFKFLQHKGANTNSYLL